MNPYPTDRDIIRDLQDTADTRYEAGRLDGMTDLANKIQKGIIQEKLHLTKGNHDYKTGFLHALSLVEGMITWIMCEEEDNE